MFSKSWFHEVMTIFIFTEPVAIMNKFYMGPFRDYSLYNSERIIKIRYKYGSRYRLTSTHSYTDREFLINLLQILYKKNIFHLQSIYICSSNTYTI